MRRNWRISPHFASAAENEFLIFPRLQLLPKLSRELIHDEFREALRKARTAEEVISLIKSATD